MESRENEHFDGTNEVKDLKCENNYPDNTMSQVELTSQNSGEFSENNGTSSPKSEDKWLKCQEFLEKILKKKERFLKNSDESCSQTTCEKINDELKYTSNIGKETSASSSRVLEEINIEEIKTDEQIVEKKIQYKYKKDNADLDMNNLNERCFDTDLFIESIIPETDNSQTHATSLNFMTVKSTGSRNIEERKTDENNVKKKIWHLYFEEFAATEGFDGCFENDLLSESIIPAIIDTQTQPTYMNFVKLIKEKNKKLKSDVRCKTCEEIDHELELEITSKIVKETSESLPKKKKRPKKTDEKIQNLHCKFEDDYAEELDMDDWNERPFENDLFLEIIIPEINNIQTQATNLNFDTIENTGGRNIKKRKTDEKNLTKRIQHLYFDDQFDHDYAEELDRDHLKRCFKCDLFSKSIISATNYDTQTPATYMNFVKLIKEKNQTQATYMNSEKLNKKKLEKLNSDPLSRLLEEDMKEKSDEKKCEKENQDLNFHKFHEDDEGKLDMKSLLQSNEVVLKRISQHFKNKLREMMYEDEQNRRKGYGNIIDLRCRNKNIYSIKNKIVVRTIKLMKFKSNGPSYMSMIMEKRREILKLLV
ncbi:hypothetical protein JTB14_030101 [Gonioctena quinquepunctata]|nr:hypothetical protein JTB14_030101 [Gonioctena quinquepunctata]